PPHEPRRATTSDPDPPRAPHPLTLRCERDHPRAHQLTSHPTQRRKHPRAEATGTPAATAAIQLNRRLPSGAGAGEEAEGPQSVLERTLAPCAGMEMTGLLADLREVRLPAIWAIVLFAPLRSGPLSRLRFRRRAWG